MLAFIFGVLCVSFAVYLVLHLSWHRWTSGFSFVVQPLAIPWFGAVFSIPYDPYKLFLMVREYASKCNHLYLIWIGPFPIMMCSQAKYAEAVLSSQSLIKKSDFYHFLHEWLGTGLLTSYGLKWKIRRKAITPSFHFAILNDFITVFEEQANRLVNKLQTVAEKGKSVDIQMMVTLATLDVICETSMGVNVHAQDSLSSEYVDAVISMNSHLQIRQKSPWLWPNIIYKFTSLGRDYYKKLNILQNFTISIINQSIKRRYQKKDNGESIMPRKKVFLEMLLDLYDKGEIDIEGICEEVDTFMFEGHDTTAAGISWTLYLLGKYPEIQEKLYAEIRSVEADSSSMVEKVKSIKYLDYVIKEALRLHPPVPLLARNIEKNIMIDGNLIPKGTQLAVSTYDLHRNPLYWEDPDTFNPDRFGDESFFKRNPYCYVPFSAGPRNCVGQKFAILEEKIFIYYVIANFRLRSVQQEDDIRSCMEIIHKSENGLMIEFLSR